MQQSKCNGFPTYWLEQWTDIEGYTCSNALFYRRADGRWRYETKCENPSWHVEPDDCYQPTPDELMRILAGLEPSLAVTVH